MRKLMIIFTLFLQSSLFAQIYTIPNTLALFSKTTDFGAVHGYLPIVNETMDSISMRWVSRIGTTCPSNWNFNFDDQNNFYGTVSHLDSGNFTLYPPGTFDQKLIIGLTHNDSTGLGSIYFTVFALADRADSTQIEYNFIIAQGTNGGNDTGDTTIIPIDTTDSTVSIRTVHQSLPLTVVWNENLSLTVTKHIDQLRVFDLSGRLLHESTALERGRVPISLSLDQNIVFILTMRDNKHQVTKVARSQYHH